MSTRLLWGGLLALVLVSGLILVNSSLGAQRQRISPHETTTSVVDGAKITITYGRPSMRGRVVFGQLVRYGRVWMPGADEATIFETTAPLRFGSVRLPAGAYSLYTLPNDTGWKLIINKMTGQFHTVYYQDQDFARLDMTIEPLPQAVEQLTLAAVPRAGGGRLVLEWEKTRVSVPFTVGS